MRGRSGPVLLLCASEKRSVRMREPQRATANSTISKANEVNYTSLATNKSDITSYTSTSHINNKICNVFIYFYIPYNFCLINVAAALKIAEKSMWHIYWMRIRQIELPAGLTVNQYPPGLFNGHSFRFLCSHNILSMKLCVFPCRKLWKISNKNRTLHL